MFKFGLVQALEFIAFNYPTCHILTDKLNGELRIENFFAIPYHLFSRFLLKSLYTLLCKSSFYIQLFVALDYWTRTFIL